MSHLSRSVLSSLRMLFSRPVAPLSLSPPQRTPASSVLVPALGCALCTLAALPALAETASSLPWVTTANQIRTAIFAIAVPLAAGAFAYYGIKLLANREGDVSGLFGMGRSVLVAVALTLFAGFAAYFGFSTTTC